MTPRKATAWSILDGKPVLFDESSQRLFSLDPFSWLAWRALCEGNGDAEPHPSEAARVVLADRLVSELACSRERAFLFIEQCLEQWRQAELIDSGRRAGPLPGRSVRGRQRRPAAPLRQPASLRLRVHRDVGVSLAADGALDESVLAAFGALPDGYDRCPPAWISVVRTENGYQGAGASGRPVCMAEPDEVVAWLKAAIVDAILSHRSGVVALHAAAVSSPELGTVLIVGRSGSGKSTLAAGLHASGMSLIGEDVIFLDAQKGSLDGLPFSFTAKPGSWSALKPLFPEIDIVTARRRPDGRIVKYLLPKAVREAAPLSEVRWILFPEHRPGADVEAMPLCRVTALIEMLKEAATTDRTLTVSGFQALCGLMQEASVCRLGYDGLESLDAIRALLSAARPGVSAGQSARR